MSKTHMIIAVVAVILMFFPCGQAETAGHSTADDPTYGWEYSTPEAQGMDSQTLAQGIDYIRQSGLETNQLLVIRNGFIVADVAFAPYRGGLHDVASVSKTIMSTILGIALDKGYIGSLDDTIGQYLGDTLGSDKTGITIRDLITMQSGFRLFTDHMTALYQMMLYGDWAGYIRSIQVDAALTGNTFAYDNFTPYVLSLILNEALDGDVAGFADRYLFAPLGITKYMLPADPDGTAIRAYGDMAFSAYDLAKIGLLYLNNGMWNGEQILSQAWVAQATRNHIENFTDTRLYTSGYGYYWWMEAQDGRYSARGANNQRIQIYPDQNMAVVLVSQTSLDDNTMYRATHTLLNEYILPAVVAGSAAKANPTGNGLLEKATAEAAAINSDGYPVTIKQALDDTYLDTAYTLRENLIGMRGLILTREADGVYYLTIKMHPSEGINEMVLPLGTQGETAYYTGRKNIEGLCYLTEMNQNSVSLFVDELGNLKRWGVTITFTGDSVAITLSDAMGGGLDMSIHGRKD